MLQMFLSLLLLIHGKTVYSSCSEPLGMEDGRIKDSQITASSYYKDPVGPPAGRLYNERGGGAWCPQKQIKNMETQEFLEIDLEYNHVITAIVTQGRFDKGNGREFVEFYIVQYWREGMEVFTDYTDVEGENVLEANTNTFAPVEREIKPAVIASKIRIVPVSHQEWTVCLRVELKGCLITELDSPYWIGVAVGIFITVILLLIIVIIFIFYKNNRTLDPAVTAFTGNYMSAYDPEKSSRPREVYRSRTLPLTPTSSEDNYTDSSSVYSGPLFQPNKAHFRTLQGVNTWQTKVINKKTINAPQHPQTDTSSRSPYPLPQTPGSTSNPRSPYSCTRSHHSSTQSPASPYTPSGGTKIWQVNCTGFSAKPWQGIGNKSFARDYHPSEYHHCNPSEYNPCNQLDYHPYNPSDNHPYHSSDYHPSEHPPCHSSEYHPCNPPHDSRPTYLNVSSSYSASDFLNWSHPVRSSVSSSTQAVSLCNSGQAVSLCHSSQAVSLSNSSQAVSLCSPAETSSNSSNPSGGLLCHIGRTGSRSIQDPLQKTRGRTRSVEPGPGQTEELPILAYNQFLYIPKATKEKEGLSTIDRIKRMSKPVINWKTFFPSPPPVEPAT